MSQKYLNPSGKYEVEFDGKRYIVNTAKPDFYMDYRENYINRYHAEFCVLSREPVPMPDDKKVAGYLCVAAKRLKKTNTFPVYVVRREKIKYRQSDGSKVHRFVYIYVPLHGKNQNTGKVLRRIDA